MRFSVTWLLLWMVIGAAGFAHSQSFDTVAETDSYRLGREDVLQIQVWGRSDLSGEVTIDFSGTIQLPLVGAIDTTSRTAAELGLYLTERYQLLDPSVPEVLVTVLEFNSQKIMVIGEVRAPGQYGFRTIPDIWAVLHGAGGAAPGANLAIVQVVREDTAVGEDKTIFVDLSKGIDGTPVEALPILRTHDTIIIPSIEGDPISEDKFQILGAVKLPCTYRLSIARTVVEAISASGGYLTYADMRKVRLTRVTDAGPVTYELDLHGYLYDAKPVSDIVLEAGDVVTSDIADALDLLLSPKRLVATLRR